MANYFARIIHEITSGASLSDRGSTLLTTLSKIEGRPMGLYLEEVG
jgi:hypothetical protein